MGTNVPPNPEQEIQLVISEDPTYLANVAIQGLVKACDVLQDSIRKGHAGKGEYISTDAIIARYAFIESGLLCFGRGKPIVIAEPDGTCTQEAIKLFSGLKEGQIIGMLVKDPKKGLCIQTVKIERRACLVTKKATGLAQKLPLQHVDMMREVDGPKVALLSTDITNPAVSSELTSKTGNIMFIFDPETIPSEDRGKVAKEIMQKSRSIGQIILRTLTRARRILH